MRGYENLKVVLYFTPYSFKCLCQVTFTRTAPSTDPVVDKLREHWEGALTEDKETFMSWLKEDVEKGPVFPGSSVKQEGLTLINSHMSESVKELSKNWQAYLFLLIETSSMIDEDPYWDYYICLKDTNVVGLCTCYTSYLSKEKSRVRIS